MAQKPETPLRVSKKRLWQHFKSICWDVLAEHSLCYGGTGFCSTLSCDRDWRHTYRCPGEEQAVGKQREKGMWDSLWCEKALLRRWVQGNMSDINVKYLHASSQGQKEVLSALSLNKGHYLCQRNHHKKSVTLPQNLSWVISACQLDD